MATSFLIVSDVEREGTPACFFRINDVIFGFSHEIDAVAAGVLSSPNLTWTYVGGIHFITDGRDHFVSLWWAVVGLTFPEYPLDEQVEFELNGLTGSDIRFARVRGLVVDSPVAQAVTASFDETSGDLDAAITLAPFSAPGNIAVAWLGFGNFLIQPLSQNWTAIGPIESGGPSWDGAVLTNNLDQFIEGDADPTATWHGDWPDPNNGWGAIAVELIVA